MSPCEPVEFEVELVSFEREGYWQHLSWQERWALADRLKDKGNALIKDKKYRFATNRWVTLFEGGLLVINRSVFVTRVGSAVAVVGWCCKASNALLLINSTDRTRVAFMV